jgi:transposase
MLMEISKAYPKAKKIHLVMDNLSTHSRNSVGRRYGWETGGPRLWSRFQVHFTPKHASWLNRAEIEISLFSRQCLGKKRVGSLSELKTRAKAWEKRANRERLKINWMFKYKKLNFKQWRH